MLRFDSSNAECLAFTFKEGLLSAVAHDLKIRVGQFLIEMDENSDAITASFDASSLRVVCAMHEGSEQEGTPAEKDRLKIEETIVQDVLHPKQHPQIRFSSASVEQNGERYRVSGTLHLHGRERPLLVEVRPRGEHYVAEAHIHQPDFGIRPYSAMLGTLKIKPDVTVRITVPRSP